MTYRPNVRKLTLDPWEAAQCDDPPVLEPPGTAITGFVWGFALSLPVWLAIGWYVFG